MRTEFEVILPLCEIPEGSKVRKIRGSALMLLKHSYTIYGEGGQKIIPPDNFVYLIQSNGHCSIHNESEEFVWLVDSEDLYYYIKALNEEDK